MRSYWSTSRRSATCNISLTHHSAVSLRRGTKNQDKTRAILMCKWYLERRMYKHISYKLASVCCHSGIHVKICYLKFCVSLEEYLCLKGSEMNNGSVQSILSLAGGVSLKFLLVTYASLSLFTPVCRYLCLFIFPPSDWLSLFIHPSIHAIFYIALHLTFTFAR